MENWVEKLINEYTIGKKELEKYRDQLDTDDPLDQEERKIISSMISDMEYALEWLKLGRRPGNRRGIERRSVYQRTALMNNMDIFTSLELSEPNIQLTEEQRKKLVDILIDFSLRERQCYLMHMAKGMSYAEIAKELNISRRTVQQYVERAKEKVKKLVS
jgi:positive control factor